MPLAPRAQARYGRARRPRAAVAPAPQPDAVGHHDRAGQHQALAGDGRLQRSVLPRRHGWRRACASAAGRPPRTIAASPRHTAANRASAVTSAGASRPRAPAQPRRQHRRAVHAEGLWQRAGRDQRRIAAVADGHVHAGVLQQIHGPRAGVQPQLVLRVRLMEAPQSRHQPQRGEECVVETVSAPVSGAGRSASSVCAIQQRPCAEQAGAPRSGARRAAPLEQRDAHAVRAAWCDTAVGVTASSATASLKLHSRAADSKVRSAVTRGWRTWIRQAL